MINKSTTLTSLVPGFERNNATAISIVQKLIYKAGIQALELYHKTFISFEFIWPVISPIPLAFKTHQTTKAFART